jgi:hypothetical protein
LQLNIALDATTPHLPFNSYFTLMLSTNGGVGTGQLWNVGILSACLASNQSLEACLRQVSQTLRCRF